MTASICIYLAIICAAVLPYFLVKAIDKECKNKDYFLLGTCVLSGVLMYALIIIIIS